MLQENFLSLFTIYFLIAVTAGVHVLLYKRDSRSAFGWLGLILLFPLGGAILYALFGVNRVQRKARRNLLRVDPEGGERLPLRLFPPSLSINLRTHRKLLIADRRTAFAGGMNIGDRQLVTGHSKHRASDLHFGFEGPVIADLVHLFGEDWVFCGGDALQSLEHNLNPVGTAGCRVVPDGPDETLDSLLHLVMGVISSARRRAWIMTPYFLPDRMMSGCLQAAALSGVDIRVMIPQVNNWAVVTWALQHNMAELLQAGVQVVQRPPPFAHSKCMIIDDNYAMVGSHNLDPRSLRLNFEVGIEVFNPALNRTLSAHFEELFSQCIPYTRQSLACRSMPARLRDAASALFAPYL